MAEDMVATLLPQVLMEHFDDAEQLQDAVNCSEECAALVKYRPAPKPLSEYYYYYYYSWYCTKLKIEYGVQINEYDYINCS